MPCLLRSLLPCRSQIQVLMQSPKITGLANTCLVY
uniref:Uncharacterized protein n=1 Tax=Anguilla anguilla TaxID=7936 RepID=A0A0E9S2B7_ANGAN